MKPIEFQLLECNLHRWCFQTFANVYDKETVLKLDFSEGKMKFLKINNFPIFKDSLTIPQGYYNDSTMIL